MTKYAWKAIARKHILRTFPVGAEFSGNDVWARIPGLNKIENRRLLSGVLLRFEREGITRRVGEVASVGGHGQLIKVWKREH